MKASTQNNIGSQNTNTDISVPTEQKILELSLFLFNEMQSKDVRFPDGLEIYGSSLKYIFTCMGVATDDQCRIWIMDNSGNWSEVKDGQVYADFIIDQIKKRLNGQVGKNG